MIDLLAAEWLKLRTTRLVAGMLAIASALAVAAVTGAALAWSRDGRPLATTEGLRHVLPVTGTGAIVVLLVGVMLTAGEHRHGTAIDTFLTTPRRGRVAMAKLAVAGLVGVVAGVVTSAAAVAAAAIVFRAKDTTFPFGDGEVWRIVAGAVAYATLFAILGAAIGLVVRNQVLAVAGALTWIGIVEHILVNLAPAVGRWLPTAAGQAMVRTPLDDLLAPLPAAALLATYAVVLTAAGIRFVATQDV